MSVDGPKTNRAHAEQELDELRARLAGDGTLQQVRIRFRSSVRVLNREWVEVKLQIRLYDGGAWLNVLAEDHPLLLSRAFNVAGSVAAAAGEDQREYVMVTMRRFLLSDGGIRAWRTGSLEMQVGQGTTEYRGWLHVTSRHGVAVRTREDGMLNLYGM